MYSLGTASKATGKSKSTILRAIKSGKISATMNAHGQYSIAPAELHRVYAQQVAETQNGNPRNSGATPDEAAVLRVELQAMLRLADERQRTIDDLRQRLDGESEERRKLTAMLTEQRHVTPKSRGFFARLLGDREN